MGFQGIFVFYFYIREGMIMNYKSDCDVKIILETGSVYYGKSFGLHEERVAEIVFNTSPVGYQEIISDPSYTGQSIVMAYPLIGNYGINNDDYECRIPTASALIVREYNDQPSNFRSTETLDSVMKKYGIVGVCEIDTRKLVREIRETGSCKALITSSETADADAFETLKNTILPSDAVSRVSRKNAEEYGCNNPRFHVVAVDCGMKENIIRSLVKRECKVTVVPWNTPFDEIEALNPDGVFLSNGPGNPEDVKELIVTVRRLIGKMPVFGICLGHQILSLAYGAKTYKLKFGHRGGNHPVKNLITGKVEITSQNHSYAVDADSIANTALSVTHINLLDNTVEGVACKKDRAFGVQYHPESAPGPQDSAYLFDRFIELMKEAKDDA